MSKLKTFTLTRQCQASHSYFNNNEQIKDFNQDRAIQGMPKLINKQIKDFYWAWAMPGKPKLLNKQIKDFYWDWATPGKPQLLNKQIKDFYWDRATPGKPKLVLEMKSIKEILFSMWDVLKMICNKCKFMAYSTFCCFIKLGLLDANKCTNFAYLSWE